MRNDMFRSFKLIAGLLILLIGTAILATAETTRGKRLVGQSGRLVKSISLASDASGKANEPHPAYTLKLNQSKLVLPGKAGVIHVQLNQIMYKGELRTAKGGPLEDQYAVVSTLRSISPTSSYAFSFCSPHPSFKSPHSFRLFSLGAGKNYLAWSQQRLIFLTEVSKGNDLIETLLRKLQFYDSGLKERQKAASKELSNRKTRIYPQDYFWTMHAAHFAAQDFGLTSMPDILNTSALITNDEYQVSHNTSYEEMFVISMSAPKQDSLSLQFVTPKMDVIYTASKKDGKWRITGKEPLTAKKAKELAPLLRG